MGNIYMFRMAPATISTVAKELIHIQANSSVHLVIHEAMITAHTTASQALQAALCIAATTNAVGSTLTPQTIQGNATALSSGYGPTASCATGLTYLDDQAWNALNGYHFLPVPELRPLLKPGARVVLRSNATHTDDITCCAFIKFEEIY